MKFFSPSGELLCKANLTSIQDGGAVDAVVAPRQNQSSLQANAGDITMDVASYDPASTLSIAPEIVWSTYLGGNSDDLAHSVTTGRDASVYVVGYTRSINFPVTPGAIQSGQGGQADVFVTKFDSMGTRLWSTYYGGSGIDVAIGVALDSAGSAWITGDASSDFPVTADAPQPSYGGGSGDGFILKLSASGARLYATFIGGEGYDGGVETAVDAVIRGR